VAYTFPNGIVVRSITGFQIGRGGANQDIDGTALEPWNFTVIGQEQATSEEVNVISPNTGPLKWVAGAYYQYDRVHIPFSFPGFDIHAPLIPGLPIAGDILLDYTTPKTTEAVFGTLTYDITDQLQVEAGARYTHSSFELTDATTIFFLGSNLGTENAHLTQNDDKVTGQIALDWKINPNNLLYVQVATGHKPGGINTTPLPFAPGLNTTVVPFRPEDLNDYEVGWKPTFFDGHLRAQLDAFYTTYTNHQLSFASNVLGAGSAPGQSIIRNVPGTSVHYGVEAQAQAVFGPWAFDASADYLYTKLGSARGSCVSVPVSQSCATGPLGLPEFIGGNQEPYAPTWNFNVGGQYAFHLADGSTLTPRIDYAYIDWQWASLWEGSDPNELLAARLLERYVYRLAPINIVNAQITWDKGPLEVSLFGTNILNDHYFNEGFGTATTLGPPPFIGFRVLREAAPPAQFGIRVSRSF
jgi:iron complex outermembrane recepter protein